MSKATYPLKLPASLKAAAARLAKEDGVSLNQWITVAVAQKIGAVELAADFFKRRAGNASPEDLKPFLVSSPPAGADPPGMKLTGCHREAPTGAVAISSSRSREARDGFAEFILGPREARTRGLAMTMRLSRCGPVSF